MDSLEVTSTKLENHISDTRRMHDDFKASIHDLYVKMDGKVSYKRYTWQFAIELMLLFSMFGYLILQIDTLKHESSAVNGQVSYIYGIFKSNDINIKN